jgi:hypothetical protein
MITAMIAFAIVACKDDFNEEEFLRLQSELKLKQDEVMRQRNDSTSEEAVREYIAAANEAGDLLSVSLIVRENGNALPGVTVTLSSGTTNEISSGRAKAVTTGITDATGNVVFDRVTIGSGTATFSKTGYVTATATYKFAPVSAPIQIQVPNANGNGNITRFIMPPKRFEEGVVQMLSATASEGSTATISGKVTIENDLTNLTPEVPTGIVLRANLTGLISSPQAFFTSYALADNSTLGRATIAADGSYTMIVPATAASSGTTIEFIVPNIEGTCRIAVNGYENGNGITAALQAPEYRNVPTGWGPAISASSVPFVPGARIVVPAAPATGSGLSFDFKPVPRSLVTGAITSVTGTDLGTTRYKIASRGTFAVPIATPAVTIKDGGGSGATATASLQLVAKDLTVTNRGTGYADVLLAIRATVQGGGPDVTLSTTTAVIATPGGMLPEALNLVNVDGNNGGFGPDDAPIILDPTTVYTGFYITVFGAGANGAVSANTVVDLNAVNITLGGSGFTSMPTFEFTGGSPSIEVVEFKLLWDVTPVMAAGTDYAVIPAMTISYPQSPTQQGSVSNLVDVINPNGTQSDANKTLASELTILGGDIVKNTPAAAIRTNSSSTGQPSVLTANIPSLNASFAFGNATDIDLTTGQIVNEPAAVSVGQGYNVQLTGQIVPSITGAPGSGGSLIFVYNAANFSNETKEWQYDPNSTAIVITNPGSGYLRNLNQRGQQISNLPTLLDVQAGKSYTLNFDFGTGERRVNIN